MDKNRIWYPDFQLSGYGILIEYCGLPERPSYAAGMARKQAVYRENGLTALMVTPDQMEGDWPGRILGQIENVLMERLRAFRMMYTRPARVGGSCGYGSRRRIFPQGVPD